nr:hypothetical protein [Neorhizobium tomejilense]
MSEDMHRMTDLEIAALVAVAQAHGIRTQARRAARALKRDNHKVSCSARSAESGARMFGHYGDCGDDYTSDYRQSRAAAEAVQPVFEDAVYAEIVAEKTYKRVKMEALERYPALAPYIERLLTSSNAPVADVATSASSTVAA